MSDQTTRMPEEKSTAETARDRSSSRKAELAHKYIGLGSMIMFILTLVASITLAIIGTVQIFGVPIGEYQLTDEYEFERLTTPDEEEYSEEENAVCRVEYGYFSSDEARDSGTPDFSFTVAYTYEQWEAIGESEVFSGLVYREVGGERFVGFAGTETPSDAELSDAVRNIYADEAAGVFNASIVLIILSISFATIAFFGKHFTIYEKSWFLSIMVLAAIFAIVMPEEACNGVSGIIIMLLYLADTFLNILCELLISKQSKWNFIVSVFVEITEILICIVLSYRFATMATTLFFWLPIDIISFFNWNRKRDEKEDELTKVRTLKGWQEALIIAGIAVWTVGIGYLLSGLDITTDLFGGNELVANIVCYLDACASAVGIVNGLAILFRFREQWIAWYICSILEAIINIMSGQAILLVLKLGYITNTTYGYIKWTKYIKAHPELEAEKSIL